MSVPLAGFKTLRLLRTSPGARVYEAERTRDRRRVLAKIFELGDESIEARVEHEFRLLQELDCEGVVRPLSVERAGRELVLLLDWVPGRNLAEAAEGRPMAVERFLPWAVSMTEILGRIHSHRIVHRDIKPSNILVEAETGAIVFADFGISVLLERERRHVYDPSVLEGTLPYVSPEQTGRTKGEVDFRSDLYSLGVTFYELLTGRRPFESTIPLELVHAHLARRPEPPRAWIPELPERLSAMVMKLLEKAPEHRYQSAVGLLADLRRLAGGLAAGQAAPSFTLAADDYSQVLQLPHQLYGREVEQAAIAAELEQAVTDSSRRTLLIRGELGVGKSGLMASVEARLSEHRGYLALAKFEEQARDKPYSALIRAYQSLLDQVLTESDVQLERWATRLREALGSVAGVVVKLVPELALVLGEPDPVPELSPTESQNRLHLAFGRLLAGFCRGGPVVLALDDLHWADEASLELLASLMSDSVGPLLILASQRSDLLRPASGPIDALIDALERDGRPCRRLELGPLDRASFDQLLVDVLRGEPAPLRELANYIERKTGRRPLQVRRLLRYLADEQLLEPGARGWRWNMEAIVELAISDDILDVLNTALERASPGQRAVLELAACVGERFEPGAIPLELGHDADLGPAELFASLHALEAAGLVDGIGRQFRFAHPRLHASVYAQIDPVRRRRAHAAIGRRLLAQSRPDADPRELGSGELFLIVDQLDAGLCPMDEDEPALTLSAGERRELGELNARAGTLALEASAWAVARRYFSSAVRLLGPGDLRDDRTRFIARFGHAQTLHLDGQFREADAAFEALLASELGLVDQAAVAARRLRVLAHTGQTHRAVALGLESLQRCEVEVDSSMDDAQVVAEFVALARSMDLRQLMELPEVSDERVLAIMHILYALNTLVFTVDRKLFLQLISLQLRLNHEFGFHASTVGVIHNIGFGLLGMGEFDQARRVSEVGLALARERGAGVPERLVGERTWLLFVGPCFEPFHELSAAVPSAHQRAVEAGERTDASFKGGIGLVIQLEACVHLAELGSTFERFHRDHEDWGSANMRCVAGGVRWFHEQMTGEAPPEPNSYPQIAAWDDAEVSSMVRYGAVITKVWAAVLLGEFDRAWAEAAKIADDYEPAVFGSWAGPRFAVLDAVVIGQRARALDLDSPARAQLVARLELRLATVRSWAARCPENFQAYVDIVEAEGAVLDGESVAAVAAYERARSLAAEHGRSYVEGLACLRLAELGDSLGWSALAEGGLRGAHRAFERWGAWAVVEGLERRLGLRQDHDDSDAPTGLGSRTNLSSRPGSQSPGAAALPSLDLVAILDTVQTISEDLRLEEVIRRVLDSAIESAGADRGVLLLEREGELAIVAEGHDSKTTAFLAAPFPLAEARDQLPTSVIHYVLRTGTALVVEDVLGDGRFSSDPYVVRSGVRSLLCMAIVKQHSRIGALVLENRLQAGAFTHERLETSRILLAQAASALDNARLYAELARNEAQWRSLVDGAPDVITLLDEQGRIEFINHIDPYDLDPRGLVGEPMDALLEPSFAAPWRAALDAVVGTGELRELELCMEPSGAPRRWYSVRLAAIRADGRLRRVICIATDITERKGFETQLRQQQRLESIGTLAAGVAHEINNPVQGILNYAELIANHPEDIETVREFSAEITTESERVANIVRNLLVFARQEREHNVELVAVRRLVEATLSLIHSVLRKDDIVLELVIDAGLPEVRCRPQQIQQIIMNLVTNARDALNDRYPDYDERKRIHIHAKLSEADPSWLQICVEDQGGGIPEDVQAQIFDPFFTTKGRDQGTGLGLSVSHGIASEHGGELRVETELGVGSRFILELPIPE